MFNLNVEVDFVLDLFIYVDDYIVIIKNKLTIRTYVHSVVVHMCVMDCLYSAIAMWC